MTTSEVFRRSFVEFLMGPELVILALAVVAVLLGWELYIRLERRWRRRKDNDLDHAIAARLRKKAALGSSNSPSA